MTTKGPSLDAIKRFKELQEQKKREENERRIREKLSTLEFRSIQGDRKAKSELKKIRDTIEKPPPPPPPPPSSKQRDTSSSHRDNNAQSRPKSKPKPPSETFDFNELMKLAKQNNNQVREKPPPPPSSETQRIPKKKPLNRSPGPTSQSRPAEPERSNRASRDAPPQARGVKLPPTRNIAPPSSRNTGPPPSRNAAPTPSRNKAIPPSRNMPPKSMPPRRDYPPPPRDNPSQRHMVPPRRPMASTSHDYEDDYESDGFVVSDEEDDARAELNETLRSVFRYDRRRCDLREQELDRQYRAIGNVSTFEDLEREERRASRLAAAEDARALREEDERKRLKKLRLEKGLKDDKKR